VRGRSLGTLRASAVILIIGLAGAIGGCASIVGFPRDPENTADTLARLAPYFDGTREAEYQVQTDAVERQRLRDAIILARIRAYDIEFRAFQRELYGAGNSISTGGDLIVLVLSGLAATTGDAVTKSALAAASAGVVGAQGVINKDLYYQRPMPALLAQMEANRAIAKLAIVQNLSRSDAEYSLWRAYLDLDTLKDAGSIPGAVANITQDAANAREAAQAAITVERGAAFVAARPDRRAVGAAVDRLSPAQLVALANAMQPNLSTRSSFIQRIVQGLDPHGLRLSGNAVKAKQVLDFWISNDDMTPAQLSEWQAALTQVTAVAPVNLPAPAAPVNLPSSAAPVNLLSPPAPVNPLSPPAAGITPASPAAPSAPGTGHVNPGAPPPPLPVCRPAAATPDRSRLWVALGSDVTGRKTPYNRDRVRLLHQCMGDNGVPASTMVYDFINCPAFEAKLGLVADCISAKVQAPGGH
jgi:hypothetical protein